MNTHTARFLDDVCVFVCADLIFFFFCFILQVGMREDIFREDIRMAREQQRGSREEPPLGNVPSRGEFFLCSNQPFGQKNSKLDMKKKDFGFNSNLQNKSCNPDF